MAKQVNEGGKITTRDILHSEEWEQTRNLYSQLCILSTAQLLLLTRLEKRMQMHGLYMKQKQKLLIGRAAKCISDSKTWMEQMDEFASTLGKGGMDDFCKMNTALSVEGYDFLRLIMYWQNATRNGANDPNEIEKYMNGLSTGKKRYFTKKLIDTFRLEEDKN